MDVLALIALVVAVTQVIKTIIPVNPDIIAVVVSVLVVAYKVIETGTPWTIALIVVLFQVIAGAIGSFKVAKQVLSPSK
jgi:hypothetical protein